MRSIGGWGGRTRTTLAVGSTPYTNPKSESALDPPHSRTISLARIGYTTHFKLTSAAGSTAWRREPSVEKAPTLAAPVRNMTRPEAEYVWGMCGVLWGTCVGYMWGGYVMA